MASKAWVDTASLRLRERDHTVLAGYHKHGRLLDGGAVDQAEAGGLKSYPRWAALADFTLRCCQSG